MKQITSVEKMKDNVFLINKLVQITLNEGKSDEEFCKIEFNEEDISEDSANDLVDEFYYIIRQLKYSLRCKTELF